jgi:hypothetical protein
VLLVLFAGGLALGYTWGVRRAPLGAAIPPRPKAVIQSDGVKMKDSDVAGRRISTRVLDRLAPQPDGAPPLDMRLHSERGDYSLGVPFGAQMVLLPQDIYKKDYLDAQITFKFGMPLFLVNIYLLPRGAAESYTAVAGRLRGTLPRREARVGEVQEYKLAPRYRFAQFTYVQPTPEGWQERCVVYVTPFGDHAIGLSFMAHEEHAVEGQALAEKIVASFECRSETRGIPHPGDPGHAEAPACGGATRPGPRQRSGV